MKSLITSSLTFWKHPEGTSNHLVQTHTRWKIDRESLTYKFKEDVNVLLDDLDAPYEQSFEDIFKASKGNHPPLLKRYYANEVSLDTLVIFENCLGYVDNLSKILVDPIWEDAKMKITKYKPFLHVDCKKYKGVILDVIQKSLRVFRVRSRPRKS